MFHCLTPSWILTGTRNWSVCHPLKSSTSFGWEFGASIASVRLRVKLCDIIWHASSSECAEITVDQCPHRVWCHVTRFNSLWNRGCLLLLCGQCINHTKGLIEIMIHTQLLRLQTSLIQTLLVSRFCCHDGRHWLHTRCDNSLTEVITSVQHSSLLITIISCLLSIVERSVGHLHSCNGRCV